MTTTVTPATFRFVHFDAEQITAVAEGLLAALGMSDRDVAIVVDETTPLGAPQCGSAMTERSPSTSRAVPSRTCDDRVSRARLPSRRHSAGCCCVCTTG
jgi:hypothetical protein